MDREVKKAVAGDSELGPLKQLPGTWKNLPNLDGHLDGHGWNMIALPFAGGQFGYRVLLNQYNETLKFTTVDNNVPNRGIPDGLDGTNGDQFVAVLDYEQYINQIAAADSPESELAGKKDLAIHHALCLLDAHYE